MAILTYVFTNNLFSRNTATLTKQADIIYRLVQLRSSSPLSFRSVMVSNKTTDKPGK